MHLPHPAEPSGTPAAVLALIHARRAASRAEVARYAGLSASTASARVEKLIELGYVREVEGNHAPGGRRPRQLEVSPALGHVAVIDLGTHHAVIGIADTSGALKSQRRLSITLDGGPETVLEHLVGEVVALAEEAAGEPLLSICVGVPGPVDQHRGIVISPSRMPGWNGADVAAIVQQFLNVPVVVENDANLMTLGEYEAAAPGAHNMVLLKAGSGIGCGIIASGQLFRGSRGLAGDISHTTVPDADPVPCSCGRTGCLDAVASGAALIKSLGSHGIGVEGPADLLRVARDANPIATNLLRQAGVRTGVVLATVVSFFNPDQLVLGGHLSQADAFVAGVHSAIYASSLPMTTENLEITVSHAGPDAALHSGIRRAIDQVLSPSAISARLKSTAS